MRVERGESVLRFAIDGRCKPTRSNNKSLFSVLFDLILFDREISKLRSVGNKLDAWFLV